MKACEKLLKNHERKTIGYLTTGGAYDAGFRVGFEMALKWALSQRPNNWFGTGKAGCVPVEIIEKELDSTPSPKPESTPPQDQEPPSMP